MQFGKNFYMRASLFGRVDECTMSDMVWVRAREKDEAARVFLPQGAWEYLGL